MTASLKLDLEKIANWPGASFYVDGYQISGRGLSRNAIGNLLAVSTIEALPSTRLHDLWLQQEFLDGQASFRVGQIAFDDEFYISQYSAIFVNSTFGCPDILSTDLPSGGPCYPFAVPGARFRVAPTSNLTLSAAVFNGNPAPPGPGDPQVRNSSGTNFLIGEGGFMPIVELAYSFDEQPISSTQLSDVKLGAWYHTAEFPDQRRDSSGRSLADPASNGIPAMHGSNFGAYLVVDKMLWRRPDTATQGLAAFLRLGYAPPDRNLFSLEIDAGLTFKGLFPNRELDVLGVGASYGRIGYARRLDRDQVLFTGIERPIRDYESVLEITYEARIAPWWLLQPDLQLVFHPGGFIAPPAACARERGRSPMLWSSVFDPVSLSKAPSANSAVSDCLMALHRLLARNVTHGSRRLSGRSSVSPIAECRSSNHRLQPRRPIGFGLRLHVHHDRPYPVTAMQSIRG